MILIPFWLLVICEYLIALNILAWGLFGLLHFLFDAIEYWRHSFDGD